MNGLQATHRVLPPTVGLRTVGKSPDVYFSPTQGERSEIFKARFGDPGDLQPIPEAGTGLQIATLLVDTNPATGKPALRPMACREPGTRAFRKCPPFQVPDAAVSRLNQLRTEYNSALAGIFPEPAPEAEEAPAASGSKKSSSKKSGSKKSGSKKKKSKTTGGMTVSGDNANTFLWVPYAGWAGAAAGALLVWVALRYWWYRQEIEIGKAAQSGLVVGRRSTASTTAQTTGARTWGGKKKAASSRRGRKGGKKKARASTR